MNGLLSTGVPASGECLRLKPVNLVALRPDLEPWDRADYDDPNGDVDDHMRLRWAQMHPLQARSLGYGFDAEGVPDQYRLPPRRPEACS